MHKKAVLILLMSMFAGFGFSMDVGDWNHGSQTCTIEYPERCDYNYGDTCREQAFHTYLHNRDECDNVPSSGRSICFESATSVFRSTWAACD